MAFLYYKFIKIIPQFERDTSLLAKAECRPMFEEREKHWFQCDIKQKMGNRKKSMMIVQAPNNKQKLPVVHWQPYEAAYSCQYKHKKMKWFLFFAGFWIGSWFYNLKFHYNFIRNKPYEPQAISVDKNLKQTRAILPNKIHTYVVEVIWQYICWDFKYAKIDIEMCWTVHIRSIFWIVFIGSIPFCFIRWMRMGRSALSFLLLTICLLFFAHF